MSELIDRILDEFKDINYAYNDCTKFDTLKSMLSDAASPWRSMEDNGPPEEKGPYFVYAPSYRGGSSSEKERAMGVMISKWTGKHWSIEVGYYKRPGCVTHWMPIEPPKEENDG